MTGSGSGDDHRRQHHRHASRGAAAISTQSETKRRHAESFRSGIAEISDYVPGADAEQVARATGIPAAEIVKLASNENDYPISEKVLVAIRGQFAHLHSYPWEDYDHLRAAVGAANGVGPERVCLSSGSAQLVLNLPLLYVNPGDEVILAPQSYALYEAASRVMEATLRWVPLRDYRFDIDAIIAAASERTKIIWLCSPNNPTGTIITRDELRRLLAAVAPTTAIVVDQAYREFVDDPEYGDPLEFLSEHPNLIALRSFSKAYAMAGLRLGYALADELVCQMLDRISEPFLLSRPACAGGLAALADDQWLARSRENVVAGRELLTHELAALGWDVIPSQGNFVLADTHQDGRALYEALLRQGVIVRPAAGWGYPTHLRVSIGLPAEHERLLSALRTCLGR